jgi:hypothetical protein
MTTSTPIEQDTLLTTFEIVKPLRGYSFDLEDMKRIFSALKVFTDKERETFLTQVTQPSGMKDEEFAQKKEKIRDNAFKVTVTIFGADGENRFGSSEQLFDPANLPAIIRGVYMTNRTAYQGMFGREPTNNFQVNISFEKPSLFDWSLVLSAPTPNISNLTVKSFDMTFANAIVATVMKVVTRKKKRFALLHAPYSYDVGLWFFGMPLLLYWSARLMSKFPTTSGFADLKVPVWIYLTVVGIFSYKFLFLYSKWAFPINVLAYNNDSAARHRTFLFVSVTGLIGSALFDGFKLVALP